MNARLMLVCGILTVGFTLGCMGGEEVVVEAPKPAAADTPEQKAASIAKAISADVAKADAALEEHGMTAEEFESLMFDIAKDPKRTEAYLEARK